MSCDPKLNQVVCSYCILLCLSVMHQTVASDFLRQITKWGTSIINFFCISCPDLWLFLRWKCGVFQCTLLFFQNLMFTDKCQGISFFRYTFTFFLYNKKEYLIMNLQSGKGCVQNCTKYTCFPKEKYVDRKIAVIIKNAFFKTN